MKTPLLAVGLVTGCLATASQAEVQDILTLSARGMLSADFATLDVSSDGLLNMDDIAAMAEAKVAALDADNDAALSLEELKRGSNAERLARIERMFPEIDLDDNGFITASELLEYRPSAEGVLARLDTDGDGGVNPVEFDAAKSARSSSN